MGFNSGFKGLKCNRLDCNFVQSCWLISVFRSILLVDISISEKYFISVGRDNTVGTTRHGLNVPGIESRWGQVRPWGHPTSCIMGIGPFPGVKRPGGGIDHPYPSSADVKDRVALYLYSPSCPSWPILLWTVYMVSPSSLSTWKRRGYLCRFIMVFALLFSQHQITHFIKWNSPETPKAVAHNTVL